MKCVHDLQSIQGGVSTDGAITGALLGIPVNYVFSVILHYVLAKQYRSLYLVYGLTTGGFAYFADFLKKSDQNILEYGQHSGDRIRQCFSPKSSEDISS